MTLIYYQNRVIVRTALLSAAFMFIGGCKSALELRTDAAFALAKTSSNEHTVWLVLDSAEATQHWLIRHDPYRRENTERLRDLYRWIEDQEKATDEQKAVARKMRAILLIREGLFDEARSVFKLLDGQKLSAVDRADLLSKNGVAFEREGHSDKALQEFEASIDLLINEEDRDRIKDSIAGYFRVISQDRSKKPSHAVSMANRLKEGGLADVTLPIYIDAIRRWRNDSIAKTEPLLVTLLSLFLEAPIEVADYLGYPRKRPGYIKPLDSLIGTTREWNNVIQDLKLAYQGRIPDVNVESPQSVFKSVDSKNIRELLAELLRFAADGWYGTPREAFARYWYAWKLNPRDTYSAMRAATIVSYYDRDRKDKIDPQHHIKIEIGRSVMGEVSAAYESDDWRNVFELFFESARGFAGENRWGPLDEEASAIGQLRKAEQVINKLHSSQQDDFRSILAIQLGQAYARIGNVAESTRYLFEAAEHFVQKESWSYARASLKELDDLRDGDRLNADQVTKLEDLTQDVPQSIKDKFKFD